MAKNGIFLKIADFHQKSIHMRVHTTVTVNLFYVTKLSKFTHFIQDLMCWDMNEITYLKQNAQSGTMFKILGPKYVNKANDWSKVRVMCFVNKNEDN